jgi:hypothetical protein
MIIAIQILPNYISDLNASSFFFFFFFDMSTQWKGEGGFEFVTSASLGMIYSRLNYLLRTKRIIHIFWSHLTKNENLQIICILMKQILLLNYTWIE